MVTIRQYRARRSVGLWLLQLKTSSMKKITRVVVYQTPGNHRSATLIAGFMRFPCVIGRSGMRPQGLKTEGDGVTPQGRFHVRRIFYRADRVKRPLTSLPATPLRRSDGWCDTTGAGVYNRHVRLPCRYGCEQMWRDDHLYDIVMEIDHNHRPRIQGRGSAVFIHLMRPDRTPTQGCVALRPRDLRLLLRHISPETVIDIR
ncbi:L,D-transpeptidase family protein [Camelimonas lactis]|uniref:L,D-peptidoglycan transpeptidase YkuD (ErfK/YbiS/YcfS/YnhG family) n=1 Tax=Camelimonas lactis TaxID=659006 RepID=A0A4R2GWJ1_9HYPH|nr:L,D-transpeptidase family protein [Camelimonas lactis]TCO14664.1 L,D-peptidoglycan transpeptidase YkuD (ErfK/YbiS/YcfS/YnhG family) [Camelimonas lactis]